MLSLWMLDLCCWDDHGSMIERSCMMGRNTDTFWKDGSKVVSLPLKDEKENETMLFAREVVKEM